MRLLDTPVYSIVGQFLGDVASPVVLDVGANRGDEARAMLRAFPRATVHAFEPSSRCYRELATVAASEARLHAHHAAASSRDETAVLIETENDLLSSLLPLNDLGTEHFGLSGGERVRSEVRCCRLDTWARAANVDRVDFIKLDVQGFELEALRGAERLLTSGVRAVYSEAQILAEYEGAATLTDLDLFLRERGFVLHQIQEVRSRGPERQTSDVDALWVRADCLASHRHRLHNGGRDAEIRLSRALRALAEDGVRRVCIYGGGAHTRRAAGAFFDAPVDIAAIIDDDPSRRTRRVLGFPVVGIHDVAGLGVDAVVISSDAHEGVLWTNATRTLGSSVRVVCLYRDNDMTSAQPVGAGHADL